MSIAVAAAVAAPKTAGNALHNQSVRDPVPQFEEGAIAFVTAFQALLANDKNFILHSLKEVIFVSGPRGGFIETLPVSWTSYDVVR